jgi:hypothetical protein
LKPFIIPFLFIATQVFAIAVWAQKAPAIYKSKVVNFGKIKEDLGKVSYTFTFTNKGNAPIRIEKVMPSCGCTAADFTPLAIPKDSAGQIKVTYTTTNRPGEFNKTISVYFQGYEEPEILTIKGIVIGNFRMFDRELVFPVGNLRFASRVISFGTIRTREPEKRELEFYNAGRKTIQLQKLLYDTTFIKASLDKAMLLPQEAGKIKVTFDGTRRKDWGLVLDTIWLYTNDDSIAAKAIPVATHIEESFPSIPASA